MKYSPVRKIVSVLLNTLFWKKCSYMFLVVTIQLSRAAKTHALPDFSHWKCADASWSYNVDSVQLPRHFQDVFLLKPVFTTSCKAY